MKFRSVYQVSAFHSLSFTHLRPSDTHIVCYAVPKMWIEVLESRASRRQTERLCLTAHMAKADEALKIGLVDKIVQDESELLPAAQALCQKLLR